MRSEPRGEPGQPMPGLMMETPLLISSIIRHATRAFADQEIISRDGSDVLHRYGYADAERRARRLAGALEARGIRAGDRVATLAWNDHRHFEVYYGVSGIGAICHTLNPRLHTSQIRYILEHAEDRLIFVDPMFVPLLAAISPWPEKLETLVVLGEESTVADLPAVSVVGYEEFLAAGKEVEWPSFPEETASSLCYTSGTTGHPKGVLYSHRSTVLHSFVMSLPDVASLGERETILPVVPMFHVNAWGVPYAAPLSGARLVLPGPHLDGESLADLMIAEEVTCSAGVPTVWHRMIEHLRETGRTIPSLRRVVIGGSAAPASMISAFEEEMGVEVRHAWGMTETSPLGSISVLRPGHDELPVAERRAIQRKQGRPVFGVDLAIFDESGAALPADGEAVGEIRVRGPWISRAYYRSEEELCEGPGGSWLATGDLGRIDPEGYVEISDRKKDVIKSGGEWISSLELEALVDGHPDVAEVAAVGIPHASWGERPVLVVVPRSGTSPSAEELLDRIRGRVPDWWVPDAVHLRDELPLGATGKVQKRDLREWLAREGGGAEDPGPDSCPPRS